MKVTRIVALVIIIATAGSLYIFSRSNFGPSTVAEVGHAMAQLAYLKGCLGYHRDANGLLPRSLSQIDRYEISGYSRIDDSRKRDWLYFPDGVRINGMNVIVVVPEIFDSSNSEIELHMGRMCVVLLSSFEIKLIEWSLIRPILKEALRVRAIAVTHVLPFELS